jgi:hypothetical protein
MYPGNGPGGVMCPNDGDTGYSKAISCPPDKNNETGPWNYAQLGVAVGTNMSHFFHEYEKMQHHDYDWGVFYATDANAGDKRCRYMPKSKGYDCPGYWMPWYGEASKDSSMSGAGQFAPGNPYKNDTWGGGAGCHFADYNPKAGIDQTDAIDDHHRNLVSDRQCQCNVALKQKQTALAYQLPWDAWVDTWLKHATPKPMSEWQGWFGKAKAPSFALDFAACWMNNPRDMIHLQNAIWFRSYDWSNQKIPTSNWQMNATTQRSYWGWNEVPVSVDINTPAYWDAVFIKLPLAICGYEGDNDTAACLSTHAQEQLEADIERYVTAGYLMVGQGFANQRPGSSVAFLREERVSARTRWTRKFFCESWTGPGKKYRVVSANNSCYLDHVPNSTVSVVTLMI